MTRRTGVGPSWCGTELVWDRAGVEPNPVLWNTRHAMLHSIAYKSRSNFTAVKFCAPRARCMRSHWHAVSTVHTQ